MTAANACPNVDPHPCHGHGTGRWEEIAGAPEVRVHAFGAAARTLSEYSSGATRARTSRVCGTTRRPQAPTCRRRISPPTIPVLDPTPRTCGRRNTPCSTLRRARAHSRWLLAEQGVHVRPGTLTWTRVADTAQDRFYSTTLTLADGRAATLFGSASKSIEVYTHGVGWAAPIPMPVEHESPPLLPVDVCAAGRPALHRRAACTHASLRSRRPRRRRSVRDDQRRSQHGGEKGTSVLLMLRPPDYKPIVYIMGGNTPAAQKHGGNDRPVGSDARLELRCPT